jgi:hypothetical protein
MGAANPGTAGGGANGNELLMPALLPTPHGQHAHASPPQTHGGQIPAGSRLSALHLNGGMPPMPPLSGGLMPTNGAAGTALVPFCPAACSGCVGNHRRVHCCGISSISVRGLSR